MILLQELFETPYFCKDHLARHFDLARPLAGHPTIERLARVAAELKVVLPVSFFERANNAFYNSLVMVDAPDTARLPRRRSRGEAHGEATGKV